MTKISRSISSRINSASTSEILLRVSVSHSKQIRLKSGICIDPSRFKGGRIIMPRTNQSVINALHEAEAALTRLEAVITDYCVKTPNDKITKEALQSIVQKFHHPSEEPKHEQRFFALWDEFIARFEVSKNRASAHRSLGRTLHRYEAYRRMTRDADYLLDIDTFCANDVVDFEHFLRNEWRYYDEYPDIYTDYPVELRPYRKTHRPGKRGVNITAGNLKKLRTFFNWCIKQGLTDNRPFSHVEGALTTERYGTPYYLTIEERDRIADYDLSARPALEVQRDIFVFQCLVGCRVSDLMRLQPANVIGDMLEYVPSKTIKESLNVVRVPLCERAQGIIAKYADPNGYRLLPVISNQRYNDAIKEICRLCGVDRKVTVINSVTGMEEQRPICELASSHMARRTFIGNIYKRVKDPNLVSSLSGHKEGSRAFVRYRQIDDDMKRGLIDLIK